MFFLEEIAYDTLAEVNAHYRLAPLDRDVSPLTDLAGYRIYYGTDATVLDSRMQLDIKGISSGVIEGLIPARGSYAIRGYSSAIVESDLSGVLSADLS